MFLCIRSASSEYPQHVFIEEGGGGGALLMSTHNMFLLSNRKILIVFDRNFRSHVWLLTTILTLVKYGVVLSAPKYRNCPASIFYKSIAGRYRPVSYPDGPITARCRFIKNAYWVMRTYLWVSTCENVTSDMCTQRRFEQSDQILHRSHFG